MDFLATVLFCCFSLFSSASFVNSETTHISVERRSSHTNVVIAVLYQRTTPHKAGMCLSIADNRNVNGLSWFFQCFRATSSNIRQTKHLRANGYGRPVALDQIDPRITALWYWAYLKQPHNMLVPIFDPYAMQSILTFGNKQIRFLKWFQRFMNDVSLSWKVNNVTEDVTVIH